MQSITLLLIDNFLQLMTLFRSSKTNGSSDKWRSVFSDRTEKLSEVDIFSTLSSTK